MRSTHEEYELSCLLAKFHTAIWPHSHVTMCMPVTRHSNTCSCSVTLHL